MALSENATLISIGILGAILCVNAIQTINRGHVISGEKKYVGYDAILLGILWFVIGGIFLSYATGIIEREKLKFIIDIFTQSI